MSGASTSQHGNMENRSQLGLRAGHAYDEIYHQSWNAVLERCRTQLERRDYANALNVKSADDFRDELGKLYNELSDESSREVMMLLWPTIEYYETFAKSFVSMMANAVDVSMMWGLLFLVVKLSLDSQGTIDRISRILKEIGHKLRLLNEYSQSIGDPTKVKAETIEINREIVMLWLNIIMLFRTQSQGTLNNNALGTLSDIYKQALQNIDEAVQRVGEVARLADRQSEMIDLARFRKALSLKEAPTAKSKTLVNNIPVSRNKQFFGRVNILQELDINLQPNQTDSGMASVTIYGLGGVGKTQIALEYAWSRKGKYDAVIWISAESELALQQELSHVSLDLLKLPGAQPEAFRQNAVLFMDWLKNTDSNWLLIFDNVESTTIFDLYWPVAAHGSVLITTRRRAFANQPVCVGIELKEFDTTEGARFLEHSLLKKIVDESKPEFQTAMRLSDKLNGLALAISQMAALINARSMSLDKFVTLYDKYQRKVHRERKTGWKYPGYTHALDTVWELSFETLGPESRLLLGILSFLVPDSIPLDLLEITNSSRGPDFLMFLKDEFSRGDVIEQLEGLALIRQDVPSATLSIHRLVQAEFLFHILADDRQDSFDASIALLLEVFPHRGNSRVVEGDWEKGAKYIGQVLSVLDKYQKSLSESEPLRSSKNLLNLICDAAWYLETRFAANKLTSVLDIGFQAYKHWNEEEKDNLILAYLLGNSGLNDLYFGEFNSARARIQECLTIYLSKLDSEDEEILNTYNNMGLAYGCQGDYQRGGDFLTRAEEILRTNPSKYPTKGLLLNVNYSRNDYLSGKYEAAEKRLDAALAEATKTNVLFWKIYIHLAYAALFCRSGALSKAEEHLRLSAEEIEEFGSSQNLAMTALQAYRLGRLTYAQGKYKESLEHFRKAEAIDKVNQSPQVFHARNVYSISKAMCRTEALRLEGDKLRAKALKMREGLVNDQREPADGDDFEAFDLLVRIYER